MSDSLYEYFPKQFLMLGGLLAQPKKLYEGFIEVAKKEMFFRIYNPQDLPIMISGDVQVVGGVDEPVKLKPKGQHLTCFAGGMVGLAAKIFDRPEDLRIAEELTAGCVWAYDISPNGIAPEIYTVMPCAADDDCKWSEQIWHDGITNVHGTGGKPVEGLTAHAQSIIAERRLSPGMVNVDDPRYILRPEAIESVFIMYRITGDKSWQDTAWRMFERIERVSRTEIAAAAIPDITKTGADLEQMDSMESFFLAETLKYFYLCFEDFSIVSLDDYVLNTEAHPLRRPK
jgi:mannosyl-oligosaccharide alpha-1,2-mannosidase